MIDFFFLQIYNRKGTGIHLFVVVRRQTVTGD